MEFIPVSAEEIQKSKREKKEKERHERDMKDPNRRQLSNVRVVQKNLVYVLGLGSKYANAEVSSCSDKEQRKRGAELYLTRSLASRTTSSKSMAKLSNSWLVNVHQHRQGRLLVLVSM